MKKTVEDQLRNALRKALVDAPEQEMRKIVAQAVHDYNEDQLTKIAPLVDYLSSKIGVFAKLSDSKRRAIAHIIAQNLDEIKDLVEGRKDGKTAV